MRISSLLLPLQTVALLSCFFLCCLPLSRAQAPLDGPALSGSSTSTTTVTSNNNNPDSSSSSSSSSSSTSNNNNNNNNPPVVNENENENGNNNNNNDNVQVQAVERHLILMGCQSAFWDSMRRKLEANIEFTTSVCVYSEQEEAAQADRIRQLKLSNPNSDIHVVATLITKNHCSPDIRETQCRAVNTGDNYLEMLLAGVRGWFLESEPNFELLGVNRTESNISSTELFPDNASGGRQVAQEFCRLGAAIAPATIAVLYGNAEANHSTARINNFIDGLEEYCPEARHNIKYSFYADWSADEAAAIMAPIFLQDGGLDAVIAANDDMALGAMVSAREMRPDKQLLVAGYDANDYTIPLLQSGAMFATVDQNPPTGLTYSLKILLSDQANGETDFGQPTECSISPNKTCSLADYNTIRSNSWATLTNSLPNKVQTAVTIRVKDPSSLVLRERLLLYNDDIRPPNADNSPTIIRARMVETRVFEVYTEASSILAQAVLALRWEDSRLQWSELVHPDVPSISVDIEDIWSPVVILSNLLKSGFTVPMTDIKTTIYPNGTVVWEQTVNSGEFRCTEIEENVFKFPFDTQMCGIDLTSFAVSDFVLVADDDDFEVEVHNDDWSQGHWEVILIPPDHRPQQTIEYRVEMTRDPWFIVLSIVVPSFLLNTISFAQHWIPTRAGSINLDRGGMAITTILAALALRDTMVAEVGNAFTLLDLFLLMSLVFQFLGFLITTYESSYGRVKGAVDENELGIGDRLGKVVTPTLFCVFCFSLSIYWGDTMWILSYLSIILLVLTAYLGRKDHSRFRKAMKDRFSKTSGAVAHSAGALGKRLGLTRGFSGLDDSEANAVDASTDSVVRYLKWQVLKGKELEARQDLGISTSDQHEEDTEEQEIIFENEFERLAATALLEASMRRSRQRRNSMPSHQRRSSLTHQQRRNSSAGTGETSSSPTSGQLSSIGEASNTISLDDFDAQFGKTPPPKPAEEESPAAQVQKEHDAAAVLQRAFRERLGGAKNKPPPPKQKRITFNLPKLGGKRR